METTDASRSPGGVEESYQHHEDPSFERLRHLLTERIAASDAVAQAVLAGSLTAEDVEGAAVQILENTPEVLDRFDDFDLAARRLGDYSGLTLPRWPDVLAVATALLAGILVLVASAYPIWNELRTVPVLEEHRPAVLLSLLGLMLTGVLAEVLLARRRRRQVVKSELADAPRRFIQSERSLEEALDILVIDRAIGELARVVLTRPSRDRVDTRSSARLATRVELENFVETDAYRRLITDLGRRGGTAVGLSGQRGSGKSELIRTACGLTATVKEGGLIGIVVPAPVAYDGSDFLRVIIREVCRAIPKPLSPWARFAISRPAKRIAAVLGGAAAGLLVWSLWMSDVNVESSDALAAALLMFGLAFYVLVISVLVKSSGGAFDLTRQMVNPFEARSSDQRLGRRRARASEYAIELERRVRYSETISVSAELGGTSGLFGGKLNSGRSLEQVPFSEADLVEELRRLLKVLNDVGYEVRIGIDELDKLRDDEEAERFLNRIKAIFPLTESSFLLSLSESAWGRYAARGIALRDAFDSSLDDVVAVEPLSFAEALRLTRRRGARITPSQMLLCHCGSGGLPRELLRQCRELVDRASDDDDASTLAVLAPRLLLAELSQQARSVAQSLHAADGTSSAKVELLALLQDIESASAFDDVLQLTGLFAVSTTNSFEKERWRDGLQATIFRHLHGAQEETSRREIQITVHRARSLMQVQTSICALTLKLLTTLEAAAEADLNSPAFTQGVVSVGDQIAHARRRLSSDPGFAHRIVTDASRALGQL